jgi:O-antigen ligase
LNTEATTLGLLRLLTAAAVFWLAVQFGHSRSGARACLQGIVVIGAVYATYGLITHTLFPNTLLWLEKVAYLDSVTSTFVNRNSYATYAGLSLIAGIALLTREIEKVGQGRTWKDKLENAITGLLGPGLRLMVLCLVLALALVLTGSRAGITSTFAALFVFVALLALRARSNKLVAAGWIFAVMGLIAALIGLVGEFYLDRLEQAGSHIASRLDVYTLTWRAALDRFWLGTGYGTFADAFPAYRDATISGFGRMWDKAHNSYVELVLGLGFPGAIILMMAVLVLVGQTVVAVRQDRGYGPAALTASSVSLLVGLHALVDFSLQIQAVTLTYVALLGLGVSQYHLPKLGQVAKPTSKTYESRPRTTMT